MAACLSSSSPLRQRWRGLSMFHIFMVSMALLLLVGLLRMGRQALYAFNETRTVNNVLKTSHPHCSPRIGSHTTVLFIRLATFQQYYSNDPKVYRGGETYVSASLDWALQQMGVTVVQTRMALSQYTVKELEKYHRIFANGLEWAPALDHHHIRCKYRPLHFWGNQRPTPELPYQARQILSPYPDDFNTFLGYFVHSTLTSEQPTDSNHSGSTGNTPKQKEKQGLIVGKYPGFSTHPIRLVIEALIQDGFVLYSVCHEPEHCGLSEDVIILPKLGPTDYAQFISEMAFLIGFGMPLVSPSPLEGLAAGVAWLNPHKNYTMEENSLAAEELLHEESLHWTHPTPLRTQHNPIAMLGAPYVYNIHLDNITDVLQAANHAVNYQFDSYVPPDFRPDAMIARACAILEDDSLCECPLQRVGGDNSGNTMNCRASPYVRNPDQIEPR